VVTFDADYELQESILTHANEFHERVGEARKVLDEYIATTTGYETEDLYGVVAHLEPDADDSDAFNQFVSEKHKLRELENTIQGDGEMESVAEGYVQVGKIIKELESEKQLYQNKIKQVMEQNNASVVMLPNGKITWRKQFLVTLNK
jgi:predicted phage-related endonuclease